jgi:hypothetical protein
MTEDEPSTEPTTDQPASGAAKGLARPKGKETRIDPDDTVEADKTDMSAVGDDGQVFGG